MDIHKSARLTPHSRAQVVRRALEDRQTPKAVTTAFGVCCKTVRKWGDRFQAEGPKGLQDRSSRPHRLHRRTPGPIVRRIEALRRERRTGQHIAVVNDEVKLACADLVADEFKAADLILAVGHVAQHDKLAGLNVYGNRQR